MNLLWFVGLVCLSASSVQSQYEHKEMMLKRDGQTFCGKSLYDVLFLVCKGRYNEPRFNPNKRTIFEEAPSEDYMYEQPSQEVPWPYMSKRSATSMLNPGPMGSHHQRFRRGPVDECCKKSCTYSELRSYCAE